jgi:uncharacterized protein YqgC (DUF456 family)
MITGGLVAINVLLIFVLLVGLVLTLIGLPGNLLIVLSVIIYGFIDGFTHYSVAFLLLLFAAYLLGEAGEFAAGMIMAKKRKASGLTLIAALLGSIFGGIAGTALLPGIGSLVGSMLVSYGFIWLAEYIKSGDGAKAANVAKMMLFGSLIGTVLKLIIAVGMVTAIIVKLPWNM